MKYMVRTVRWGPGLKTDTRLATETVFEGYDPKALLKQARSFIAQEVSRTVPGYPNFVAEAPKEVREEQEKFIKRKYKSE